MQRKERGAVQTKKRSPPVKLGARLLSHLRRWQRIDGGKASHVVHFRGSKIDRPIRSWDRARREANLPAYVVPHILRHSRATHMLQQGISLWDAANYLGMSVEVLAKHYGHHQPGWQGGPANVR
jgi:integrase